MPKRDQDDLFTPAPLPVAKLDPAWVEAAAGPLCKRSHSDPHWEQKLAQVKDMQAQGLRLAMVGDGLNDGPVLARADTSFALGQAAPLAQAQSDFVLQAGKVMDVVLTLQQAKFTMRIVRQNLVWAALYNLVSVPLALVGWMPPWLAGLGMAGSSLLVILNALRLAVGPAQQDKSRAVSGVSD